MHKLRDYRRDKYKDPPKSASGLKGVLYFPRCTKRPWKSYIRQHGQYICIGYFKTRLEAAMAYNRKALQIYGAEAYLNPLSRKLA